ncbi:thioredoxin family protein [Paenibacillus flagellatus]|uniref:Thioredoxin n=1 Tax=Paenibacillus flagellatus TaxID=2211139 RepID=A0A2V5KE87_9BACL|nr:thioredoxin domain-containing protein [Paenibacillus flagellatus]PYI56383.1 thiol reductase thioredoxin [Paenibacillus flagellatus]
MAIVELTDSTYEEAVREGVVLVEFWAEWCTYCKLMTPILNEIEAELGDRLTVATVNAETEILATERMEVMSLPALFLYADGQVVGKVTGYVPKETLVNEFLLKLLPRR